MTDELRECAHLGPAIVQRIASAHVRAWLISPYVTSDALVGAVRACSAPSKRLVTRFDGRDIVAGATDLRVIGDLKQANVDVRIWEGVHAKVYVLDDWSYVGSANLTARGLDTSLREFGRGSQQVDHVSEAAAYFERLWRDAIDLRTEDLEATLNRLEMNKAMLARSAAVQQHVAREIDRAPRAPSRRPGPSSSGVAGQVVDANGIVEFHDVHQGSHHDLFMAWRRDNETGFYLTMKSRRRANLHEAWCQHQGHYDFGEYDGSSATRDRKICSNDPRALYRWARDQGVEIHRCITCKPPEF